MVKAVWNGQILAESGDTVIVEGNYYFPRDSLRTEFFEPSRTTTLCPWKGTAHYFNVVAGAKRNPDCAWFYPDPKPAAAKIKDRVAFWKGVTVD